MDTPALEEYSKGYTAEWKNKWVLSRSDGRTLDLEEPKNRLILFYILSKAGDYTSQDLLGYLFQSGDKGLVKSRRESLRYFALAASTTKGRSRTLSLEKIQEDKKQRDNSIVNR